MEKISFSLNVNFVVQLLNGSVGEILIFVNLVTRGNVMETMLASIRRISYQYARVLGSVQWEEIITETGSKNLWGAQFVETINRTTRISD